MAFKPYPCSKCGIHRPSLIHAPDDSAYFVYCDGCGHGGSPAIINPSGDENEAAARAVKSWNSEWLSDHLAPLEECVADIQARKGRKRI